MVQKCGSASGMSTALLRMAWDISRQSVAIMLVAVSQPGGAAELRHHLAAGEPAFGAAGVLGVGHDALHPLAQADGFVQEPAAVGIQGDPRFREAPGQGGDHVHLGVAGEHAALELEVAEAVAFLGGFGQGHHGLGGHGLLPAQRLPAVCRVVLHQVRQVRPGVVADEEEVAEHRYRVALLPVAEQFRDGDAEELPVQVQQG